MMIQGYIRLVIILVALIFVLYLPFFFILKRRDIGVTRQLGYLGLLYSAVFIVFITIILFGIPISFKPEKYVLSLIPFVRFKEEADALKTFTTEMLPNVMIFIPIGFFIPVVFEKKRKLYKTALIVFFITFSIEFFQYFTGRLSDIDDIIMNLSGGIIGYGIFKTIHFLCKDKKWWNKFIGNDLSLAARSN